MSKISDKLLEITSKIFGIDKKNLSLATSRENTPEWDSLNHLMLLTEIEKTFKFKFNASETVKIKSLHDIDSIVKSKGIS